MIGTSKCELCGEPMPPDEEMFKFHGYSGPCPKPPLPRKNEPELRKIEFDAGFSAGRRAGLEEAAKACNESTVYSDAQARMFAWQPAMDWAEGLAVGGHRDFSLPTRPEQALLYANVGDLFARDWYWSSAQYAGDAGYAWCQGFDYGGQYDYYKSSELRARAVRRIPQ